MDWELFQHNFMRLCEPDINPLALYPDAKDVFMVAKDITEQGVRLPTHPLFTRRYEHLSSTPLVHNTWREWRYSIHEVYSKDGMILAWVS